MTDTAVKTCVSCKHFKGPENLYAMQNTPGMNEPSCEHPQAASRDPIYGKALCRVERNTKKGCGTQGKLWASKS